MVEAWRDNQRERDWRTSYFVTWLMGPHLKKPVNVDAIFNPLWVTKEEEQRKNLEERKKLFAAFGLKEEVKK